MMFATDFPMEDGSHAVKALDVAPFSDADRETIYQLNAERLFRP